MQFGPMIESVDGLFTFLAQVRRLSFGFARPFGFKQPVSLFLGDSGNRSLRNEQVRELLWL
jgi:hypothetical protein